MRTASPRERADDRTVGRAGGEPTVIEAKNRCRGRAANDGGMFKELADEAILSMHADLVARIDANTCDLYPERDRHVKQIALTVLRAKGMA